MPITVFRSRLNDGVEEEYRMLLAEMVRLAPTMPGFVAFKSFAAQDGERVTIVEFADDESQLAWAGHERHLVARKLGRETFYKTYDIAVCAVERRYLKTEDGTLSVTGGFRTGSESEL